MLSRAVLFVCLGNICRSPLAEGIFKDLVENAGLSDTFTIDSAGTGPWHVGNPPDARSIEIAARHGIDISGQRARKVADADFETFDVIVAMDAQNLSTLTELSPAAPADVRLLLNAPPRDVPDPFFGGPEGFDEVYHLIRSGCGQLLDAYT
ncbi:low molecular weight protein-tyrosine-phosphatase [uncultured Roseibium sp.]|uniref:low molecular weight protein-tyrosine-phosphatase n=1 Tax=uncultured Roseibium sp. TaxID=1936171 RepID=UPI002634788F|nr:low molecular weight protein-tyrosine-phosphatase [uncultured Roseibium sp.]